MAAYASVTSQFEIETRLGLDAPIAPHQAIGGSDVDHPAQSPVGLLTRRSEFPLDVSVCSGLCGVPDQSSAGVPARDPDRLIKWFIGAVVIGVGVNLLSRFVVAQKWVWLPPAVFVAALLVAVPSTGLLRRERYGTTRARAVAFLALTGYLAVTVWGSVTG